MTVLGSAIDWDALLEVVWSSLAAGIAVTIAASIAIVGATRFDDARRDGHGGVAIAYGIIAIAGVAAVAGAITIGLIVMTDK